MTNHYVVATIKPWNIEAFARRHGALPGAWHLVQSPERLTPEWLLALKPRYVFFPHWSWIVPDAVLEVAECVCFHMTDVPYGRGGSPLQNLIARGHGETRVSALRMVRELDAGPVYLKRPLALTGRAQEIYVRLADVVWDMIGELVVHQPGPLPQEGTPTVFPRRRPEQGRLPEVGTIDGLYDHIRMLDAETYPHAFLEHGRWRLEFTHAERRADGTLRAMVTIGPTPQRQA